MKTNNTKLSANVIYIVIIENVLSRNINLVTITVLFYPGNLLRCYYCNKETLSVSNLMGAFHNVLWAVRNDYRGGERLLPI